MIKGGDFRQVLPVIQKGSKAQMIYACIIRLLGLICGLIPISYVWYKI